MINKSFQLIRTNPLLTTNFKVVVDSNYKLYLESFNTNNELSNVKYKHFLISKSDFLENKIPLFYKNLPVDIAFDVRYDNDNEVIKTDYKDQFDTIYYAGGGYVEDQWYSEEFDYLAPLYIRKENLPVGFIILRVDDPSGYNLNTDNNFELNSLSSDNFNEIVNNWKCVKFFDMSYSTDFGQWLYKNYINNDRYPKAPFEYHPERAEFSHWFGMDYKTGVYTYRSMFMDDRDEIETPHFKWEKFITEGYKKNELIYPYIINFKFLFDDNPATPDYLRKYSMNRYYGFYVDDFEYVGSITSYKTPDMIPNTYLINNIILSGDTGMTTSEICNLDFYAIPSPNPFVEKWDENKKYYVFIDNTSDFYRTKTISNFYQVERILQDNSYVYKVISDEILDNYWNTGYTNIKTANINYYNGYNILSGLTNDFFIDKYKDCSGEDKYLYSDLYLIKMDDKYHVIKYSSGMTEYNDLTVNPFTGESDDFKFYIQTDYAINLSSEYLEYWIKGNNSEFYNKINVISDDSSPLSFPIYRIKFSDIKDFDFDRVNTQFSNFDYEKTDYVETEEEKLYAFDYIDDTIPHNKRVGKEGYSDQDKICNVSSEYIADDELYEIFDLGIQNSTDENNTTYKLSEIWRKNQSIVKWGFMGSISHSDYPYKLNNNYEVGGPYNRTTNPFYSIPDVISKNMDYFYRLGNFYSGDTGNTIFYKNQTTNIQWDHITNELGNGFDVEAYFGGKNNKKLNFDYFTYFFKNKMFYEDNFVLYTKSYDKYAIFNYGDSNVSSVALFKGLKFKIREVKNIYLDDSNNIIKILYGDKSYNNYKISIILNENYNGIDNGLLNNNGYIDNSDNNINIILNEKFQNILIIINVKFPELDTTLNNIDQFDEKKGLYYGEKLDGSKINTYNPNLLVANNFINAINNSNGGYGLNVKYYFIREIDGVFYNGYTFLSRGDGRPSNFNISSNSTMKNIPNWNYNFQPYILSVDTPVLMNIKNNCYSTYPYYVNSVDDDYVSTLMTFDETKSNKTYIYRFPGPYEPIFKNINLFRSGFFCYNNISGSTEILHKNIESYASNTFEENDPIGIGWRNFENICNPKEGFYVEINCPFTSDPTPGANLSRYLCINGFNFSDIPDNAIISGITMNLIRKSYVYEINTDPKIYTHDYEVRLTKDCTVIIGDNLSENKAIPSFDGYGIPEDYFWVEELKEITYPNNGDLYDLWNNGLTSGFTGQWTGNTLSGRDVKNSKFGVVIKVGLYNGRSNSILISQISCIRLNIKYKYDTIVYDSDSAVYFDSNYKFDTELNDFGKIDELIFSKVNETTNILNTSIDQYNIYPTIDEYGYDYSDRFVFKSSWDKEFFTRTENSIRNIQGNV